MVMIMAVIVRMVAVLVVVSCHHSSSSLITLWPGYIAQVGHDRRGGGHAEDARAKTGDGMKAAELFDLTGRVALVTGASGGLGLRFAQVLAANGAAIVLVARRPDRLEAARAQIEAAGGRASAFEGDVLDRDSMARAFDHAEAVVRARGHSRQQRRRGPYDACARSIRRGMAAGALDQSRRGLRLRAGGRAADDRPWPAWGDRQYRVGAGPWRIERDDRLCDRQGGRDPDDQGARPGTGVQGRAGERDRAGLVRHRHQPRVSRRAGRRRSRATFPSAASAATAISTARCCCSSRRPAPSWPAPQSSWTAGRWWRCGADRLRHSKGHIPWTLHFRQRSRTFAGACAASSPSMCCLWRMIRRISPITRISPTPASRRCAKRRGRRAFGLRNRRRSSGAWRFRSWPGPRCTRRRRARCSGRSCSTAWRRTMAI